MMSLLNWISWLQMEFVWHAWPKQVFQVCRVLKKTSHCFLEERALGSRPQHIHWLYFYHPTVTSMASVTELTASSHWWFRDIKCSLWHQCKYNDRFVCNNLDSYNFEKYSYTLQSDTRNTRGERRKGEWLCEDSHHIAEVQVMNPVGQCLAPINLDSV